MKGEFQLLSCSRSKVFIYLFIILFHALGWHGWHEASIHPTQSQILVLRHAGYYFNQRPDLRLGLRGNADGARIRH